MNRLAQSLCMLLLAASLPVALAAAPAAGGAGAGRGAGGGGRGAGAGAGGQAALVLNRAFYATEMDTLAQQLTLTDAQKTRIQDKADTMNKEIDTFLQNAPAQIAAARGRGGRGAGAGRGGRGAAAVVLPGSPNPIVLKMQDDLQQLINEHQVLINQELSPGQRLQWETYKLNRILDPRIATLSLTDDQRDKVRGLIDDTAKTLAELTEGKTTAGLQGQLFRKIIADVLTDAQISRLFQGAIQVQGGGRGPQPAVGAGMPAPGG